MNGRASKPWELSPLGAGETCGSEAAPLLIPFPMHGRFNQTDFAMLTGKPWEIWLEYEDVFGKSFHSIQRKPPVDTDLSTAKRRTAVPDQRPRAGLRHNRWFAYNEGPMP